MAFISDRDCMEESVMTNPASAQDARMQLLDEATRRLNRYDAVSHSSDEDGWADLVFRLMELVKAQRTTVVDAQTMLADRTALTAERARAIEECLDKVAALRALSPYWSGTCDRISAAILALASAGPGSDKIK
jgi:hypothetical protein